MSSMIELVRHLTPLSRVLCSKDLDKSINYITRILPFQVHQHPSGSAHNGWLVPPSWDVTEATIHQGNRLIYDGTSHALGVIALSTAFRGRVELGELKKHLHYDHRYDDSLTFHYRQQYRVWDREWGFCVPKTLYDSLTSGDYDVVIETDESPGALKLMEHTHLGRSPYTICFCANLDHPGVSNDGLAGVAVGIELFRRLRHRATKYTYKLVLVPGIIGSEYFLGVDHRKSDHHILEALCLWMLGSETQLALQLPRGGLSNTAAAIERAMTSAGVDFRTGPFESIIINDDYIWEAYGIPTASLSRFPYPEYHSSRDNPSIISAQRLAEVVEVLVEAVNYLEATPLIVKKFEGTVCLSNPRYDLYVDAGQVAFGDVVDGKTRQLRLLMDFIPAMKTPMTATRLAQHVGLAEEDILPYLHKWRDKGLLEIW